MPRCSILVCVQPARGHVGPVLPVVAGLIEAGHDVRVITGRRYGARFEALGARWLPLPDGVDFDDSDLDASFPERRRLRGVALARFDLTSFVDAIPAHLGVIDRALDDQRADVVLCDPLFMGAVPLVLRPAGQRPPVLVLGILPMVYPVPNLAPASGPGGAVVHRLAGAAAAYLLRPVQRTAEARVLQASGRRLGFRFSDWPLAADGLLQFTAPGFEYPRALDGPPVHFVGPLTSSGTEEHLLPPWWAEVAASDRPVVLATQGTIANAELSDLIAPTISALEGQDVWVVVSTGGSIAAGDLPEATNLRTADYLPFDEVLPRCSVFVSNGGYGGVNHALRHGVPILAVGATEDKRDVVARVRWSGCGVGIARRRASARQLGRALHQLLTDPAYRGRAEHLAAEIAAAPGLPGLVRVVESYGDGGAQDHRRPGRCAAPQ
ncbi:MAG: glycosyltransferase [Tetrasphaera sp.]